MTESFPLVPIDLAAGIQHSDHLGTRCRVMATGLIEGRKQRWPTALFALERRREGQLEAGYFGERKDVDQVYAFLERRGWDSDPNRSLARVLKASESDLRRPVYPSGANASKAAGGWAFRLIDPVGVILEDSLVLPMGRPSDSWGRDLKGSRWVVVYLVCGIDNLDSYELESMISSAMSGGRTLGAALPVLRKSRESEWRIRIEPDPWL